MKTTTQCLKVDSLRKDYKDPTMTLKKWMENANNVYVGRRGRVFIGKCDDKKIFHYKGSKFANPFTLKEHTLEESLKLYEKHLKENNLIKDVKELRGKNLGCFCDQKGPCHAKILARIADRRVPAYKLDKDGYVVVKFVSK